MNITKRISFALVVVLTSLEFLIYDLDRIHIGWYLLGILLCVIISIVHLFSIENRDKIKVTYYEATVNRMRFYAITLLVLNGTTLWIIMNNAGLNDFQFIRCVFYAATLVYALSILIDSLRIRSRSRFKSRPHNTDN